jgi:protein-S-isoprenylcysteine O-methyltransferase Ste14
MVEFLQHLQAIVLLPVMVTLVVPALIVGATDRVNPGWSLPVPLNLLPIAAGVCLVALGLLLMIATISLFVRVGKGTLAPWLPTRRLVVRGVYGNVRNPMITGVLCILFGEVTVVGSSALLYYAIAAALLNAVYIPLVEEPGLVERFGADYELYRQHVLRWIPRLRAWDVPAQLRGE